MSFRTPVDIANRALQHCGATRIDPLKGFAENSKNAAECAFCYDKVRRAELRRNVWAFATKRAVLRPIDVTTRLLAPSLWSATVTYFVGSIVSDETGTAWISQVANNLNNDPLNSATWQQYFGPLTVSLYDTATAYYAGEVVYTTPGDGSYRVYLSLQNSNSDTPSTPAIYDPDAVYLRNQVVTFNSVPYMSLIDLNTGNQPDLAPAMFNSGATYATGDRVGCTDGVIYQSLSDNNIGNDPLLDNGLHWLNTGVLNPWTTIFVGGAGALSWLEIGGAEFPYGVGLTTLNLIYPVGSGPSSQGPSRSVFKLPANYLRKAPQNPGSGPATWLGGPSGIDYDDWAFEAGFLITGQSDPLVFRFVADVTDVTIMDDMFCEGLAARIGIEVCEPLTQSSAKLGTIGKIYDEWMSAARTVNGIETGSDDPPDDAFISVRY